MTFPDISLPAEVYEINSGIFTSSTDTLAGILMQWPRILIALGLIVVGFIIMQIIRFVITKIAKRVSVHKLSTRLGFTHLLQKAGIKSSPSEIIAKFIGGWVFTVFFLAASNVLGLQPISEFLDNLLYTFIPHLVVALFIVLIGFQIAKTIGAIVGSTLNFLDEGAAKILQIVATNIIILFSVLAALLQLNIAEDLVKILFTGVVGMIALAGGLAIGLGGKDFVKDTLEQYRKK